MNDTELDHGLHAYYESIAPADSTRATNLVAMSIRERRERGNRREQSSRRAPSVTRDAWARPRAFIGVAVALAVVVVAGVGFVALRAVSDGALPGSALGSPSAMASTPTDSTRVSETPVVSASKAPTTRPTPTLRAATKSTPAGRFSWTGSMNGRYDTATLLQDGRVLMTGDYTRTTTGNFTVPVYSNLAELFDPATGTFRPTGSMVRAQGGATATRLQDGRTLIVGGIGFSNNGGQPAAMKFTTAELYDPATGQFSLTGSMGVGRADQTATLLDDGEVLIAGGDDLSGALATAELYDPKAGTFRPTGAMTTARARATATLLSDGRVLVIGGMGATDLGSAELYDPGTGKFSPTGSMSTLRSAYTYTATLLRDGDVLIAGGQGEGTASLATAELYDPATGTFGPTGSMATSRGGHTATLLSDGRVLIAGGAHSSGVAFGVPGLTERDEAVDFRLVSTDTQQAAQRTDRPGGFEAVFGGQPGFGPVGRGTLGATVPSNELTSAELYDPSTGKFSPTGSMGIFRADGTATPLADGRVLFAGGDSPNGTSAELYQP
jgi:hypothetical protein